MLTRITLGTITLDLTDPTPQELANGCMKVVAEGAEKGLSSSLLKVGNPFERAPEFTPIASTPSPVSLMEAVLPPAMTQVDAANDNTVDPADLVKPMEVDPLGELRSLADLDLARAAGFAPKPTVFRRGMRVVDVGVENARKSRLDFENRPTVEAAVSDFTQVIIGEGRVNHVVRLDSIVMNPDGSISARGLDGAPVLVGEKMEQCVFEQYANMLAGSVGASGPGRYLSSLTGEWGLALRRQNLDTMLEQFRSREAEDVRKAKPGEIVDSKEVMLRARKGGVFALTGKKYPCFDAHLVAAAVAKVAGGRGMRAEINYNGHKATITALAHTTVKPEHFVAGEFFLTGFQVTTCDDGRGAVHVRIILHQNLCLNLIILDVGKAEIKMIRHKGDVAKLAKQLEKALEAADKAIKPFLVKWGYACKEIVSAETVKAAPGETMPKALDDDALLAGVFRDLIRRKLVPVGARKAENTVTDLVAAFKLDTSGAVMEEDGVTKRGITRAGIVNAITRVAHTSDFDQDMEEAIQTFGSRLVDAKKYPFMWMPSKDEQAANEDDSDADITLAV